MKNPDEWTELDRQVRQIDLQVGFENARRLDAQITAARSVAGEPSEGLCFPWRPMSEATVVVGGTPDAESVLPIVRGPDGKAGVSVGFQPFTEGWFADIWRRACVLGSPPIDGGHKERARRKQERIDSITKAEGVMPSDAPRVLAEHQRAQSLTWAVLPADSPMLNVPVTEEHFDTIEQMREALSRKPAKTLPGALSEARGGHRLGGWGAVE